MENSDSLGKLPEPQAAPTAQEEAVVGIQNMHDLRSEDIMASQLATMVTEAEKNLLDSMAKRSTRGGPANVKAAADTALGRLATGEKLDARDVNVLSFLCMVHCLYTVVARKRILIGEHPHKDLAKQAARIVMESRSRIERVKGLDPSRQLFAFAPRFCGLPEFLDRVDQADATTENLVRDMWSKYR